MKVLVVLLLVCLVVSVALGAPGRGDRRGRRGLHCKRGAHPCSDGSRCVPRNFFCDGVFDCGNGEDEADCASRRNANVINPAIDEERDVPTFGLEFGKVRNL